MPNPAVATVATSVGGELLNRRSAKKVAGAQLDAVEQGTGELRTALEDIMASFQPFQQAGTDALSSLQAFSGLGAPEAQAAAAESVASGPLFEALSRQGEDALLANAAATGGLRGGDLQAALAQFRPTLLNEMIQQRIQNLQGLSGTGLQAAQLLAPFRFNTAEDIVSLMSKGGQIRAEKQKAFGEGLSNVFGTLSSFLPGMK